MCSLICICIKGQSSPNIYGFTISFPSPTSIERAFANSKQSFISLQRLIIISMKLQLLTASFLAILASVTAVAIPDHTININIIASDAHHKDQSPLHSNNAMCRPLGAREFPSRHLSIPSYASRPEANTDVGTVSGISSDSGLCPTGLGSAFDGDLNEMG